MTDAFTRRIEIMMMLIRANREVTIPEIRQMSSFADIPERTLQRDLLALLENHQMKLICDDSTKPYRWRLEKLSSFFCNRCHAFQ